MPPPPPLSPSFLLLSPLSSEACPRGHSQVIVRAPTVAIRYDYAVDANQELLALGVANIAGSFFLAYPTAGSLSRSALVAQASEGGGTSAAASLSYYTPVLSYISPPWQLVSSSAKSRQVGSGRRARFDLVSTPNTPSRHTAARGDHCNHRAARAPPANPCVPAHAQGASARTSSSLLDVGTARAGHRTRALLARLGEPPTHFLPSPSQAVLSSIVFMALKSLFGFDKAAALWRVSAAPRLEKRLFLS